MKLSPTLAAFTNGVAVRQALPEEALLCGAFKTLISIAGSSLVPERGYGGQEVLGCSAVLHTAFRGDQPSTVGTSG